MVCAVSALVPFGSVTDGCKEANFMQFSHGDVILHTVFWKVSQKMLILLKNSIELTFLQPPIMVAKGKISFATMTHVYKAIIIDQIRSLLEN